MKILYITGIHPLPTNKSAGHFITQRLNMIKENGVKFKVIAAYEQSSWGLKFIKKIINKNKSDYMKWPTSMLVESIKYDFLPYKVSLKTKKNYEKRSMKMAESILNEVNVDEYDLIHAHWIYPHGYAASIISEKTGIPYVVSAHGSDIHTQPYKSKKLKEITVKTLESSQKSFFVSESLCNEARKLGYKTDNSLVLYNGVDTSIYKEIDNNELQKHFNIKNSFNKHVGFVGRLHKVKGADRLPIIFKGISLRMPDVEFWVIGDGPLKEKIKKECQSFGLNVRFMGNINALEVPYFMNLLNVLVLPSRNEGLPNVVLEAKACGCPTVATNVGGIREAVEKDGLVVNYENDFVKNFVEAVIKILEVNLDKEKIISSALKFNWDKAIKKQISVYEEIINSND